MAQWLTYVRLSNEELSNIWRPVESLENFFIVMR